MWVMAQATKFRTYAFTDDYGRRAHSVYDDHAGDGQTMQCIGRIVRMPVSWIDSHPGQTHMTNDWRMDRDDPAKVQYHGSLAEALNRFEGGEN